VFKDFFLVQKLDDVVQLINNVFPFQNNMLATNELAKQKYD